MSLHRVFVGNITITVATDDTDSDVLGSEKLGMARTIIIYGPAALTAVCTVRIGPRSDNTFAQTVVLAPGGTPVVVTALEALPIDSPGAKSIAIIAASAEAADRVFPVYAVLDIAN